MFPVTTSVQVTNENLESHGRAGAVVGNEQTHPMLTEAQTAQRPFALQVERGTVAVLLDGDNENTAFALSDIRVLN